MFRRSAPSNDLASEPARALARAGSVGGVMAVLLSILLVALLGRVVQLQAYPAERLGPLLDDTHGSGEIKARRGAIVDRRGRPVAISRVAYRMFVDPLFIDDHSTYLERLAFGLGYDPAEVGRRLMGKSHRRYVVIDPRVPDDKLDAIREAGIPGVYLEPYVVREYPFGTLAGQLIGFVGSEGVGLEGIERRFDRAMQGSQGAYRFLRDRRARPMWVESRGYQAHAHGEPVRLTIDARVQQIAEQELERVVGRVKAKAGQIVVMEPYSGDVLAVAHYPLFDPGSFGESDPDHRRNRVVTDVYEPGSIFKPFIWAGLTELRQADPGETIDCEMGAWRMPNGRTLRDAKDKGLLSWSEVLMFSSNIGMAKVAARVDPAELHGMVAKFGFGSPTGSGLPGEVTGVLRNPAQWTSYSMGSIPMGHEVSVTAMQVVRGFCVLANGGYLVTPRLVQRVGDEEQGLDAQNTPPRVLSARAARLTRQVLRDTVSQGSGRLADSPFYEVFGKTGTAELPNAERGGYHRDRYISSFVAGAPTRRPRLVVGVFVHDPDKSIDHYGGRVSAPAARRVLERSLAYLGEPVLPGQDPRELIGPEPLPEEAAVLGQPVGMAIRR
ncbi:MAG: penicillin-binding protein 2 [Planctomycetota bacterium]